MELRKAAQQALDVMEDTRWAVADQTSNEDVFAHDKAMNTLRAALADTKDWDELEALRASLREHMAEIHRLRAAAWHAFYALSEINSPLLVSEITRIGAAMSGLRAALAEDRSADTGKTSDVPETSFEVTTFAVHVGYRYQSPVGGWEYGDHIPAWFDTNKWAHQKIYILQEQA